MSFKYNELSLLIGNRNDWVNGQTSRKDQFAVGQMAIVSQVSIVTEDRSKDGKDSFGHELLF